MVLIEPETKQQTYQRETRQVRQETPVRREAAAQEGTREITLSLDFFGKVAEAFNNVFDFFRSKMTGKDMSTIGLSPQKRSEHYIKQCWNHMAMNNVDKARESYDSLVKSYEAMDEGPAKTNIYYEVYDIYQRLAEVK